MFETWKKRQAKQLRITKLRADIAAVYEGEMRGANTPQQRNEAYQIIQAQVMYDENELDCLLQQDLISRVDKAGIKVRMNFGMEWNGH